VRCIPQCDPPVDSISCCLLLEAGGSVSQQLSSPQLSQMHSQMQMTVMTI